jgi:signal peptidase I
MNLILNMKKFYSFLKKDTWQSWIVSLILAFILIKFIFFPFMSLATGSPLPLVVVESCSMYHSTEIDDWWDRNALWYEDKGINRFRFDEFGFKKGLNKGDIILVYNRGDFEIGDIIIYESEFRFPLIHRIVTMNPLGTKGDNNFDQLEAEKDINEEQVLGKSFLRIPGLGWVKLIFFEGMKPAERHIY